MVKAWLLSGIKGKKLEQSVVTTATYLIQVRPHTIPVEITCFHTVSFGIICSHSVSFDSIGPTRSITVAEMQTIHMKIPCDFIRPIRSHVVLFDPMNSIYMGTTLFYSAPFGHILFHLVPHRPTRFPYGPIRLPYGF